jgi:4'-phosphopantetheinyl transferase
MVNIYGVKLLDDLRFLELKGLVSAYLPDDSSKKASKFKHPVNAQRQIIGELLVRAVICNNFGLANDEILFRYSEHKKPSLKNHNNIHFNISHSGDWVVCAVSAKEVGIDVEKIRETNFNIARRFFSNDEVKHLFALPKNQQLEYFFDLWTLKESYLKTLGTGLTKPLSSFTVKDDSKNIELYEHNQRVEVFLKKYRIDKKHKLSACGYENKFAGEMERLFIDDLLRMVQ